MDIPIDLTVIVGLDANTIEQWKLSLPTIAANRKELLRIPWVIFYDHTQIGTGDILPVAEANGLDASPHIRFTPWPPPERDIVYPSQRGKMLAGFIHVPLVDITTQWFLKIDTDVVASKHDNWIEREWFKDNPVVVASPWGYTKVKGEETTAIEWCRRLESWGDDVMGQYPRLDLQSKVRGEKKIIHKRFWSPVSYYATWWAKMVARMCNATCRMYRLPVPSQDTVHWYVAERSPAEHYTTVQMKRHGWVMCSGMRALRRNAAKALDIGVPQ